MDTPPSGVGGVLSGFAVLAAIVAVGYAVGRLDLLGPGAESVLSRFLFFVATPALLLATLARADVAAVLTSALLVAGVSVATVAGLFASVARLLWRCSWAETTVGALASSYVNAVNLGIPVAVYVLGDASYVVPVLLLQLAVLTPAALTVLDTASRGPRPAQQRVLAPVSNPITIACLVGLAVGLADVPVPETVLRPVQLVGGAAVPVALITFGLSLHRAPVPGGGDTFRAVWLAVALKTVVQPAVAFVFASFALGMRGTPLLGVTVTAALPTAQNVFVYATRYGRGVALARDAVLLTTFFSLPVLLGIAAVMQ